MHLRLAMPERIVLAERGKLVAVVLASVPGPPSSCLDPPRGGTSGPAATLVVLPLRGKGKAALGRGRSQGNCSFCPPLKEDPEAGLIV